MHPKQNSTSTVPTSRALEYYALKTFFYTGLDALILLNLKLKHHPTVFRPFPCACQHRQSRRPLWLDSGGQHSVLGSVSASGFRGLLKTVEGLGFSFRVLLVAGVLIFFGVWGFFEFFRVL